MDEIQNCVTELACTLLITDVCTWFLPQAEKKLFGNCVIASTRRQCMVYRRDFVYANT